MITAGHVLRSLGFRRQTDRLRALDALEEPERRSVVAALDKLPADAAVDLDKLIAEARVHERERIDREALPNPQGAFNYWLTTVATEAELRVLKRKLEEGKTVEQAMPRFFRQPRRLAPLAARRAAFQYDPEELDDDPDELPDEDEPSPPRRRRRKIARHRPRSAAPSPAPAPKKRQRRFFSSAISDNRPYGCPEGADYDKWRNPGRPPWQEETVK